MLEEMLMCLLDDKKNWLECLPGALWSMRTHKHSSTGFSPFELLYNRKPRHPWEVVLEQQDGRCGDKEMDENPFMMEETHQMMIEIAEEVREKAHQKIKKAQRTQKYYHDMRVNPKTFNVGDKVWKENRRERGRKAKLQAPYIGLYTIVERC